MDEARLHHLIKAVAAAIIARADELTELDSAIGDGDHGINMKRGAEAVLADLPKYSGKPVGDVMRAVGMQIVMKVGGASGPLFGTWAMEMGKHLNARPDYANVTGATAAAFAAVKARGKSQESQKTMLDVLGPVLRAMETRNGLKDIRQIATAAAEATIPVRATRGRASFLGDRSVGHMDPGAMSASLIVATLCDELLK